MKDVEKVRCKSEAQAKKRCTAKRRVSNIKFTVKISDKVINAVLNCTVPSAFRLKARLTPPRILRCSFTAVSIPKTIIAFFKEA